jgi:PAS domain S-box-containing protein
MTEHAKATSLPSAKELELRDYVAAIDRVQAVIEFDLDGVILNANDNFLKVVGYRLAEVQGQHHSMFVDRAHASSAAYRAFWDDLRAGHYRAEQFTRITKDGSQVWLQASYNPILGADGRPYKVIKFATDITEQCHAYALFEDHLRRVAQGDLTAYIEDDFGEQEVLKAALNRTLDSLNSALTRVRGAADEVAQASREASEASESLAAGAQEQGAAAEQSSSALEETAAAIRANSESAKSTNELVLRAAAAAAQGQQQMAAMQGAMDEIKSSSSDISRIIKVIDEIAFQTNLLAINAAVEAARAGEHGKGFAVVAQEVRSLAERSAKAAKETEALIADSSRTVEQGVGIATKTAASLEEIVDTVMKVRDLSADVAVASEQQSRGVSEVSRAIAEVNTGAQRGAEQSAMLANAAESMADQVAELRRAVDRFTLKELSLQDQLGDEVSPELLERVLKLLRQQERARSFADRLNTLSALHVREARDGDALRPGQALVAPSGSTRHMKLLCSRTGFRVGLREGPAVSGHRPSVDVLFQSVARAAGAKALGVLLTGMGSDGAQGLASIRNVGGRTLAQDEASCVVYGMPGAAVRLDAVEEQLPPEEMAERIQAILLEDDRLPVSAC